MGADTRKIAKNTIFLYFRMLLVLAVSLYTSRIVLQELGIDNYGVYNLVQSIIIIFSFLKISLNNSLQRYFNHSLGKNNKQKLQEFYSTGFSVLAIVAIIILIMLETIGLWLLNYKLNLTSVNLKIVNIIYQLSVVSLLFQIFRTPFESLIMAHERMHFYAWISIVESLLKLGVAFILIVFTGDELLLYSILILGVTIIINIIYSLYCRRFKLSIFGYFNRASFKELASFSWWNVLGSIADLGYQQGTGLILNSFYGVALNATMGITNSVKDNTFNFVRNVVDATRPQIYKTYSGGEGETFSRLIFYLSKVSYYLFFIITILLIFNMDYILKLWLGIVPPYCTIFCTLILVFCLVDSLIGPLWTGAQAYGKIKIYQLISSSILLLNLPLTYIVFSAGMEPYSMLYIQIIVCMLSLIYRIYFLYKKHLISLKKYFNIVILPISLVTIIVVSACMLINWIMNYEGLLRLLYNTPLYLAVVLSTIWFVGIGKKERKLILS